jgi:hypothetical protein
VRRRVDPAAGPRARRRALRAIAAILSS